MELDAVEFSPAWVPAPTFLKGRASRVPGSVSLRQKEKGQNSQAASRFLMRNRIWCAGFARSNLTLCSLQNAERPEESKAPCWCPGCEGCAPHTKYALLFACLERSPDLMLRPVSPHLGPYGYNWLPLCPCHLESCKCSQGSLVT